MFWIRRGISEAASRIPMEIDSPFALVWSMTSGGSFHTIVRAVTWEKGLMRDPSFHSKPFIRKLINHSVLVCILKGQT